MNTLKHALFTVFFMFVALVGACAEVAVAEVPAETSMRVATRYVECNNGASSGSAVAIAPGLLVTAKHVASQNACKVARYDGSLVTIAKTDLSPAGDFALIHAEAGCPCVADVAIPARGETVTAVGYPYGTDMGRVQVLTRGEYQGEFPYHDEDDATTWPAQVTTAQIQPGNSGGGFFVVRDGRPFLIGVAVMMPGKGSGISVYIPISMLDALKGS